MNNTHLRLLNGPGAGRSFPLAGWRMVAGRNDPPAVTVDIDLTDFELGATAMISRRHAEFRWVEGVLQLVALPSRNGTFVDDEKLATNGDQPSDAVSLKAGTKVRLADLILEVVVIG